MSVPPRSLTLEVWLGPMEGLRYAAEARQAMQLVRVGRLPFDRQSKERNHLVLSVSAGVSGSHAEVRFAFLFTELEEAQYMNYIRALNSDGIAKLGGLYIARAARHETAVAVAHESLWANVVAGSRAAPASARSAVRP